MDTEDTIQNMKCIGTVPRKTKWDIASNPARKQAIWRKKRDTKNPKLQRPSGTAEDSETQKLALTQNEIVHVTTKVNFIN